MLNIQTYPTHYTFLKVQRAREILDQVGHEVTVFFLYNNHNSL